jgi:hypothetical protein
LLAPFWMHACWAGSYVSWVLSACLACSLYMLNVELLVASCSTPFMIFFRPISFAIVFQIYDLWIRNFCALGLSYCDCVWSR